MKKLISVIIPVYNVEQYLEICVKSVLGQTYSNLEIILVDDGSTDRSGGICDNLSRLDKRIFVYHKSNGGLADARNYGMKRANGDFLAFIDSDDALHKDFFSLMMKTQQENNADIVSVDMTLYHDLKELVALFKMNYNAEVKLFFGEESLKEYFSPSGNRIIHHGLCMKIYKRKLFNDLEFEKGRLHEDLFITYQLLDRCHIFAYISSPYYFYFQNNKGSICTNYGAKNFIDESEAYSIMYHFFSSRESIRDQLLHFIIIQYLLMFEKSTELLNRKEIKDRKHQIISWVDKNVWKCSYFSIMKKVLIHISMRNIGIYIFLKGIRKK